MGVQRGNGNALDLSWVLVTRVHMITELMGLQLKLVCFNICIFLPQLRKKDAHDWDWSGSHGTGKET